MRFRGIQVVYTQEPWDLNSLSWQLQPSSYCLAVLVPKFPLLSITLLFCNLGQSHRLSPFSKDSKFYSLFFWTRKLLISKYEIELLSVNSWERILTLRSWSSARVRCSTSSWNAQTFNGPCLQIQKPCRRTKWPCELERSIGNSTSCTRVLQCLTRWSQLQLDIL